MLVVAKVAAAISAAYYCTVGVMRFGQTGDEAQYYILAGYFIIFGILILMAVVPMKVVTQYFPLLGSGTGMGGFLVFMALLLCDWNESKQFELGSCLLLLVAAGINILVGLCT